MRVVRARPCACALWLYYLTLTQATWCDLSGRVALVPSWVRMTFKGRRHQQLQMWCAGQSVRGKMCGFLGEAKLSQYKWVSFTCFSIINACIKLSQYKWVSFSCFSIVNACKATVQTVRTIRARVHARVHVHVQVVHAYVLLVRLLLYKYYK